MASQQILEADKVAFSELGEKPYVEQAKWFLNAFWSEEFENSEEEREKIYLRTQIFIDLDEAKGKDGCSLDEFQAHRLLEKLGETLTILALREKLRKIDLDADGKMSLSEYFLFLYEKQVTRLVRPQADPVEVQKASEMVQAAQASVAEMSTALAEQQAAFDEVKAAEDESRAAVAELKAQEDAFNNKVAELEKKSEEGGVVSRGRAKAELQQLKAEDPLPLRRAKITQEAALRRVEKARKAAEAAKDAAEEAVGVAEKQLFDAKAYLDDVSSRVGSTEGTVWFLNRELTEAQKYMPSGKRTVKPSSV